MLVLKNNKLLYYDVDNKMISDNKRTRKQVENTKAEE